VKTLGKMLLALVASGLLLASLAAGSYIAASSAAERKLATRCDVNGHPVERRAEIARNGAAGGGYGWTFSFRDATLADTLEWARVQTSFGGKVVRTEPEDLRAWPACGQPPAKDTVPGKAPR
jgi:hypothetical protein